MNKYEEMLLELLETEAVKGHSITINNNFEEEKEIKAIEYLITYNYVEKTDSNRIYLTEKGIKTAKSIKDRTLKEFTLKTDNINCKPIYVRNEEDNEKELKAIVLTRESKEKLNNTIDEVISDGVIDELQLIEELEKRINLVNSNIIGKVIVRRGSLSNPIHFR